MTSAIITLTQGDFLYIDEWIQYHHNIGIELFCIGYNGDSKDFNKLPKYDYVKYFDFSTNDSEIFNEFNSTISKRGWSSMWCGCVYIMNNYIKFFCTEYIKYVAIIDVDEFISPQEEFTNITEYLDNIYDQSLQTEFISMQVYNGNGNIYYEDKPVLERFNKSINPNNPLFENKNTGFKKSILNVQHIDYDHILDNGFGFHENYYSKSENNLLFNKIVLKHFVCKSLEEWIMKMSPKYDRDYCNRFKGIMFSGWGSYFTGYLDNKITNEALQAIPKLLKKYDIYYKPEIEEENEEFKKLYRKANNIKITI